MTMADKTSPSMNFPPLNASTLGMMFVAGAIATIAFDLWGHVLSPLMGWAKLAPQGLARALLGSLGLPKSAYAGYFLHFYLVGLLGYPFGWLFIFQPAWDRITGGRGGWFPPSLFYGFGLWVFAIGGITWIAGLPFFLNFSAVTWVALAGHVLYGVVMVAVLQAISRR